MRNTLIVPAAMVALVAAAGCGAEPTAAPEPGLTDRVSQQLKEAMGETKTSFADRESFQREVASRHQQFKADKSMGRGLRDRYPEALEVVDRFELYLLQQLGEAKVAGQVVLSDNVLFDRSMNRLAAIQQGDDVAHSALVSTPPSNPPTSTSQVIGDYKAIGESFKDNYLVYTQIGAYTEFTKWRKKYWWSGHDWYDTDAEKLSVRSVYFVNPDGPLSGVSFAADEDHDSDTGDDYISERSVSFGGKVSVNFGDGQYQLGSPGLYTADNYDGVVGFHAVTHCGGTCQWRMGTSRGVRGTQDWGSYPTSHYVPWQ